MAACAFAQSRPDGLYAVFQTSAGNFTAKLYEKEAPGTVENFVALAQGTKPTRSPKTGDMVKRLNTAGVRVTIIPSAGH